MNETTANDTTTARRFEATCGHRWTTRDGERLTCGIRITGNGQGSWRHDKAPVLTHPGHAVGTIREI